MRSPDKIESRVLSISDAVNKVKDWKDQGKTIAFTNGCFDLLHRGHIYSLSQAAKEADYLIVGLNSDSSTKNLKGEGRPVNDAESRAVLLASLVMVDGVVIFNEDTPLELIKKLMPDVLVKGGDYTVDQIAGAREVIAAGGRVVINPIIKGHSTTALVEKISKL